MTPADYLTAEQAQKNYPMIREHAGRVLNPGPWKHASDGNFNCIKCGKVRFEFGEFRDNQDNVSWYCSVPDPDPRPMVVIASDLFSVLVNQPSGIEQRLDRILAEQASRQDRLAYWLILSDTERAAIVLSALEAEK